MNNCTDQHHPPDDWRPQTTQTIWIHALRHILVNTDNEEIERQENIKWEGVIGSLTISLLQSGSASHISIKGRLLDINRTNYASRFTRPNEEVISLFIFNEVHTSRRFFYRACQNRSIYETRPWTLNQWNWQGCCHAMSNRFDFSTSRALQILFWSLLTTRACGRRAELMDSLANQE